MNRPPEAVSSIARTDAPSNLSTPTTQGPVKDVVLQEATTRPTVSPAGREPARALRRERIMQGVHESTTPATPELTEAEEPLIGRVVSGRYRVLERIGRGGMGVVYRVEHVELGKVLAMKVLSGAAGRDPTVAARFQREARLVSKLFDPHTVQVSDYGVSDGVTWIVMQLISGKDLSRVLAEEGRLRASRVAMIVDGVCRSLSEAHALGIVHRDIKPSNIMLTDAGGVMVLDFGLAKMRDCHDLITLSAAGVVVGTPGYMSPDQAMGDDMDGRADIYGIGATMFRMLVGYPPFSGGSPAELCVRQLCEPPPCPHRAAPELGIPPALSEVVRHALEPKRERRYANAEELRAAVHAAVYDPEDSVVFPLVRRTG